MKLPALNALAALVVIGACSPAPPGASDAGAWVGTITTEGEVTTVVNESGSVWGGTAALVEEVSIGVEAGADPYMFGQVQSVWATEDRILVVDAQVPAVRVYDFAGQHLFDVGRGGQGPGEFDEPGAVAVTRDDDILVVEHSTQIEVFAPDGTPKATWNTGANFRIYTNEMLILGADDTPWVPELDFENRRFGFARIGADGKAGAPDYAPELEWQRRCLTYLENGREDDYCGIPFQPSSLNAMTPEGAWVVGTSDAYGFEIHKPDGSRLRVERYWTPVPVTAEEADYHERRTIEYVRERADNPAWTWNGPPIPDHKPAFVQFIPDRNGRIWVLREQPSRLSTDCLDDTPSAGSPRATGSTPSAPTAASWAPPPSIAGRPSARSSTTRRSSRSSPMMRARLW